VLLIAVGCGDDGAGTMPEPPAELPQDVDGALEANCRPCHSRPTLRFAPMSLVSWDDTQKPTPSDASVAVFEMMEQRIQSEKFPMPPEREPPMSDSDRATLLDWIADGALPEN
jgi:hypothetical protein